MILLPPFSCSFIALYWQNREGKRRKSAQMETNYCHGEEKFPVLPPLMCVSCFLSVCWEHNQIIIWEEINFYTWMVYYTCVFSTCWLCRSTCFRNGFSAWRVLAQAFLSCLKKKLQVGESSCDYTHGVLKTCTLHKTFPAFGRREMLELMFHDWCCFLKFALWKNASDSIETRSLFGFSVVVVVRALEWMAVNIHCVFQRKKLWLSGSCRSIHGWRFFLLVS